MTESTVSSPRASAFEDYIDIFYAPSAVFARRRDVSPWIPLLVVTGLFAIATYISFTLLGSVYEAEFVRQAAKNPQVTAEQLQGMGRFATIMGIVGGITTVPLATLILGLLLWVVGKLVDAEQPLRAAFLVIVFSFMPRVLEAIVTALQAFVIDTAAVQSIYGISLSPARFMDPEGSMAMLVLASRLSPFILWSYAIIAIGLAVTGRITVAKAAIAAVVLWMLGALPAVLPALTGG